MAVDTSNAVYGGILKSYLWPAQTWLRDSEGNPSMPDTGMGPPKSAKQLGFFTDHNAAQAIIDQVNAGSLTQDEALKQLGPLVNPQTFYPQVNQIIGAKEIDQKAHEYDPHGGLVTALQGTALVAGAGALGGAFSGAGAGTGAGAGAGAGDAAGLGDLGLIGDTAASTGFGGAGAAGAFADSAAGLAGGVEGADIITGGVPALTTGDPTIAKAMADMAGGAAGVGAAGLGALSPGAGNAGGAGAAGGAASAGGGILGKILSGGAGWKDFLGLLGPAMGLVSAGDAWNRAGNLGGPGSQVDVATRDIMGGVGGANIDPNAVMTAAGAGGGNAASMQKAISGADPWGTSGGRALADKQLQSLMQNPNDLLNDPGYKARMMGVERQMASQGYTGSGNMAAAAANASGDFYNQRLASLGNLENMGNPVGAQQIGLGVGQLGVQQGQLNLNSQKALADLAISKGQLGLESTRLNLGAQMGANSLAGQGLASLGFGVTQATGGNTTMPPAVKEWFKGQGIVI